MMVGGGECVSWMAPMGSSLLTMLNLFDSFFYLIIFRIIKLVYLYVL